ncbi:alpha/beta hydrolase [Mycolicibacterium gadium]|uniref:Alpha/beta hydrolase n=1 Tax=Mycolicibacterium gadium TaxID=1794 RepID=A0ABT6GSK9_MYCGU|nr:alpha/beta hydrolase family protein [Mycolicibacterium gadium]MDG5484050.1 alpha/beta hydrolase [Mycolicibacterium gadium]
MSRPPILLLHGMFSTPKLLSGWVSLLESAGYRVHAPAYPGHDPVDMAVLSRVTLSDYIAAALTAYDELDETPIVIGHSIGGLVAQHVAAAREPRAVVLLAPVPPGVLWPQLRSLPHLFPIMGSLIKGRPVKPSEETFRAVPLSGLPAAEQREVIAGFVPDSAHVFRSMSLGSPDTRVDPHAVHCPVLCVSGGADRNVATWISRRIARRYSAQQHHHPDLPHWIVANSALHQVAPPVMAWLDARVTESVS